MTCCPKLESRTLWVSQFAPVVRILFLFSRALIHLDTVKPLKCSAQRCVNKRLHWKQIIFPFSPSWAWSLTGINVLLKKNRKSSCLEEPGSQIRGVTQKSSSNTHDLLSLYHWWGFFAWFNHLSLPHPFVLGKRCLGPALGWGGGDGACAAHLDLLTGFKLSVCNQSVLQTQFSSYLPFKQLT